ncbi:hypothetical protein C1H46_045348 [Malus baccata]|uniref:PI4-kinase N-terminal domain-containing protein n=1 Tax=Malus baccata TaxID=106549 RepID=A0A540K4G2_MALBA|nr:hypothetical protein C1H46_045348 [Malus baccata]
MEALMELCDLIAEHPAQFTEKLSWICGRCPPPEFLLGGSPRVSRIQLNAVLAIARFISKCPDSADLRPKSVVLEFLRSVPASFNRSFWPQSFGNDSIASFFSHFLGYVSKATELSPDFATEIAGFTGEVIVLAISSGGEDLGISRAFLMALSEHFPPILPSDAEKLITMLIDHFAVSGVVQSPVTPRRIGANSETSSAQSSPMNGNHYQANEGSSPRNEASNVSGSSGSISSRGSVMMNGSSIVWKSGVDQLGVNFGLGDGGGAVMLRQQVSSFEEESVENLEKQDIAFKLVAHILDKVRIDSALLEQVRFIAKRQLQSMSVFLKVKF